MNRKILLIIFLLGSLILLVGGVHRPERSTRPDDPAVRCAESLVSQAAGSTEEWRQVARDNPLWILEIEATEER